MLFFFWDVEYICLVEGREGRSFKQAAVVGCVGVDNGVQSGRKQVESETKSWQEMWYRKNDSAILAHKEKRRKRRANVVGSRLGTGSPLLKGNGAEGARNS